MWFDESDQDAYYPIFELEDGTIKKPFNNYGRKSLIWLTQEEADKLKEERSTQNNSRKWYQIWK